MRSYGWRKFVISWWCLKWSENTIVNHCHVHVPHPQQSPDTLRWDSWDTLGLFISSVEWDESRCREYFYCSGWLLATGGANVRKLFRKYLCHFKPFVAHMKLGIGIYLACFQLYILIHINSHKCVLRVLCTLELLQSTFQLETNFPHSGPSPRLCWGDDQDFIWNKVRTNSQYHHSILFSVLFNCKLFVRVSSFKTISRRWRGKWEKE